ncbi:MAG: iron-regulated protein [Opitutaceae bacterium]|nr:iron-regulated protein [Opitutaceae bacterium]
MRKYCMACLLWIALIAGPLSADFELAPPTPEGQPFSNEIAFEFLGNYATLAWYLYSDSVKETVRFNMAVYQFRKNPGEDTFEEMKRSWIEARKIYGRSEAYRFSDGPIDQMELEILINAWPVDESYIDYTVDDPSSGIINNPTDYPEITSRLLRQLNQKDGETNISTGWHAVEFLLWGQDLYADGPGQRKWTDFTEAPNADRRMKYLVVATELLRSHLVAVADAWSLSNYDNHTGDFFMKRSTTLMKSVMRGVSSMAGRELAAERMSVALRSKSQEDEHSCFSDTTHFDLVANMEGLEVVLFGTYKARYGPLVEGKGFIDVIADADQKAAQLVRKKFLTAKEKVFAVDAPFDQAIIAEEGSEKLTQVKDAVGALWSLVYALADAEELLELDVKRG